VILIAILALNGCAPERTKVAEQPVRPQVRTVCELFESLESHQNERIAVRGVYDGGSLRGFNCAETLVAFGRRWETALDLRDSHLVMRDEQPVPFATDGPSWDRLDRVVIEEAKKGGKAEIWATFEGMLRGPRRFAGGKASGIGGYGHLGWAAASLVIERVYDIEVLKAPTIDYGKMLGHGQERE